MAGTGNSLAVEDGAAASEGLSACIRIIQSHYRINPKIKSEEEVEREKWLLPGLIRFSRWFGLPAAFIIQFCCGSLYTWSVYNKPIDKLIYGEVVNIAPITFYIAVGCYGCAAALIGPWLERHGPRRACILGTTLFFVGNLVTALALYLRLMWLVFVGYGIIAGPGIGICYVSPVSALQKWFPDRRGLGAGFATCGFGAGSIIIAKIQIPLMNAVGLPLTFVVLGLSFFTLMSSCALVLRTPPPNFTPETSPPAKVPGQLTNQSYESDSAKTNQKVQTEKSVVPDQLEKKEEMSLIDALTSRTFRIMLLMFGGDIVFGLVLASRFSNIVTDIFQKSPEEASTVVSVNGAVNFLARLSFSILSDYFGRKNSFTVLLTCQLIVIGCFSTMTNGGQFELFWVSMCIVTACYGAAFGVIPAFLTDKFGPSNIGALHGIMIFEWAMCGVVGGLTFTMVFDSLIQSKYSLTTAYNVNAWWLFGIIFIGWVSVHFVPPTEGDKNFNGKFKKFFLCRKA